MKFHSIKEAAAKGSIDALFIAMNAILVFLGTSFALGLALSVLATISGAFGAEFSTDAVVLITTSLAAVTALKAAWQMSTGRGYCL